MLTGRRTNMPTTDKVPNYGPLQNFSNFLRIFESEIQSRPSSRTQYSTGEKIKLHHEISNPRLRLIQSARQVRETIDSVKKPNSPNPTVFLKEAKKESEESKPKESNSQRILNQRRPKTAPSLSNPKSRPNSSDHSNRHIASRDDDKVVSSSISVIRTKRDAIRNPVRYLQLRRRGDAPDGQTLGRMLLNYKVEDDDNFNALPNSNFSARTQSRNAFTRNMSSDSSYSTGNESYRPLSSASSGGFEKFARRISIAARTRKSFMVNRGRLLTTAQLNTQYNERRHRPQLFNIFLKIKCIVHLRNSLIKKSMNRTEYSAIATQYFTLQSSIESRGVAFNKDRYQRKTTANRLPPWAKQILRKNPSLRSPDDGRRLHVLFRDLSCFDKFTEEMQVSLCQNLEFIDVDPGRILIRMGQEPAYYYAIYSGSVFNLQREEDGNIEETVLGCGQALGEISLLKGTKRDCTVYARERCEILFMEKATILASCAKLFQREHSAKTEFLQSLELFQLKGWTQEKLFKLCLEAQTQYYKTERIIAANGYSEVKDEWIYVCMEGKCKVFQIMSLIRKTEESRSSSPFRSPSRSSTARGHFITSLRPEMYGFGEYDDDNDSVVGGWDEEQEEELEEAVTNKEDDVEESDYEDEDLSDEDMFFTDEELENHLKEMEKTHPEIVRSVIHKSREEIEVVVRKHLKHRQSEQFAATPADAHVMTEHIFRYETEKMRRKSRSLFRKALEETKLMTENEAQSRKPKLAINFTGFLQEHLKKENQHNLVLVLADLSAGDIFDLSAILYPKKHRHVTRLLISGGAKILKIRRTAFFRHAYGPLLEEIQEYASEHRYPNLNELKSFFHSRSRWLCYKGGIIDEIIGPLSNQARRRYQSDMMKHVREVSVMQPLK